MNKIMNFKKMILVLGVLLASAAQATDDKNLDRKVSGSDVLAAGASSSTDVCLCNTVGGTIAPPLDKNRADYLLNGDSKTAPGAPSSGAEGTK